MNNSINLQTELLYMWTTYQIKTICRKLKKLFQIYRTACITLEKIIKNLNEIEHEFFKIEMPIKEQLKQSNTNKIEL